MCEQPANQPQGDLVDQKIDEKTSSGVVTPAPTSGSGHSDGNDPKSTKELSAEEQMALYEKELKENDWGHQPC